MIVVSDSTVLIGLGAIGGLDWLKQLYGSVIVPTAVYQEVTVAGAGKPGAQMVAAATWIQPRAVNNQNAAAQLINLVGLDEGESEAIILAQEISETCYYWMRPEQDVTPDSNTCRSLAHWELC